MTEDEQHLDLLAVFHYIVGGVMAIFSCLPLIHLAVGIAMVTGALGGKNAPPKFFGWLFILLASLFILGGWALAGFMIATGRKLKKRVSRTFCLIVAGVECCFTPFGTVLGVFTIVVLMKESVKQLFNQQAAAGSAISRA